MRLRLKLSLVLVVLVLVPLLAGGLLLQSMLAQNEEDEVDGRLSSTVAGASVAYRSELAAAGRLAEELAARPDVQQALREGDLTGLDLGVPPIGDVQVVDMETLLTPAPAASWRAEAQVGDPAIGRVVVTVPLDQELLTRVAVSSPRADGVDLALAVDGEVVASTNGRSGTLSGTREGQAVDASLGGQEVRAQTLKVAAEGDALLATTYPAAELAEDMNSLRLRILVVVALLGTGLVALALFAADRITRALRDLAARAMAIVRSSGESAPPGGDELEELGIALDVMSTELSTRMTELAGERERLRHTLARYGETLAATHDLQALVGAVLDTAVQATRSRGGRLLLYDGQRGEAAEQARIGTARGSRTDLPMVVPAGRGLEGHAIQRQQPQATGGPRPMLAVPVMRENQLLGVVTVVDPEDGAFSADDVETLSGLAVQAGVAIENARLHRQVEQQAVTDELSGLANRRQFFEVLGREYERAQRFGQPLALILLDIDDFKQINDTPELGHLAGDAVIRSVADTIGELIREIDLAARYGGEEFAVLLPQTSLEGAVNLAERLRVAIADRELLFGDRLIEHVTASFGVAAGPDDDMGQLDLIAAADDALYRAKREGKNHVSAAGVG